MSDDLREAWNLTTRLVHAGERRKPPAATPTATPIYTSATYLYTEAADLDAAFASGEGFVYARYGNPTVAALEEAVAAAEQAAGAVAYGSGMAALHAALLAAGTPRGEIRPQIGCILAARDLYGATTNLLEDFFAAQGVPVYFCDMCNLAEVEAAIADYRPDIVLVETISNPLLRVADIPELARLAHTARARLVVDATLTTPVLSRPIDQGADLVVHSATKFLGGHGDVVGGLVAARSRLLLDLLHRYAALLGATLGPFEAAQILRGIKTLALRVRQQCANAAAVADWLDHHPAVGLVYYPGLPTHPQHELATRLLGGQYGALVAFDLRDGGRDALFRVVDGLKLILPATSLGDVYTLVSMPVVASHRDLTQEQRAERGITDRMLRLSIGIEDASDLIADLRTALA